MLHRNSNTVLQTVFSSSIPYNDTRIKASKVSKFNEACKWLLIAFGFENPLSQIAILREWQVLFVKVSWDVANWYTTCWCTHKIALPHTICCCNIHASEFYKFKQLSSTCIAFTRCQSIFYDQSLWLLLSHSFTNFFITWIILWTEKNRCVENK